MREGYPPPSRIAARGTSRHPALPANMPNPASGASATTAQPRSSQRSAETLARRDDASRRSRRGGSAVPQHAAKFAPRRRTRNRRHQGMREGLPPPSRIAARGTSRRPALPLQALVTCESTLPRPFTAIPNTWRPRGPAKFCQQSRSFRGRRFRRSASTRRKPATRSAPPSPNTKPAPPGHARGIPSPIENRRPVQLQDCSPLLRQSRNNETLATRSRNDRKMLSARTIICVKQFRCDGEAMVNSKALSRLTRTLGGLTDQQSLAINDVPPRSRRFRHDGAAEVKPKERRDLGSARRRVEAKPSRRKRRPTTSNSNSANQKGADSAP